MNAALPPDVTVDALSGPWRIHQRRRGHRWSIDDLLTAHVACLARPHARRALDLGCGIGSVLMLCAYRLREASLVGVEAQEVSAALCRASLRLNGLTDRVELRNFDFRDPAALRPDEKFDLITGTPPYLPVGTATMPADPQRAACRIELRGGVEDYCRVAADHLMDGGAVVLCSDGRRPERTRAAAREAGLTITGWLDLIPLPSKGPLFHVVTLERGEHPEPTVQRLLARDAEGRRTRELLAVRDAFDMPRMPGDDLG
ncbi:MAG: methyltransferase [Myxococcota bacterium]